jgi:Cys-tRNA(Pro)/Cys-tRNA(Cys) deacylase
MIGKGTPATTALARARIDASAFDGATIFVSGGRRGLELELAPADLVAATAAVVAPIADA